MSILIVILSTLAVLFLAFIVYLFLILYKISIEEDEHKNLL